MSQNANKSRALELGLHYAKNIMEMDDEVKQLKNLMGTGFWKDFHKGFKKGFSIPMKVGKKLIPEIAPVLDVANEVVQASGVKHKKKKKKKINIKALIQKVKGKGYHYGGADNKKEGGTKAQEAERERLNDIALKYTGKSLDEINEVDVTKGRKTKKSKPSRRITPTIISTEKKRKTNRSNIIQCDKGLKIVKSRVKSTNPNDRRKRRGALIKKLMKDKGLKFIEASQYIKKNNLKY